MDTIILPKLKISFITISCGFHLGVILYPREHLAMPRTFFYCNNVRKGGEGGASYWHLVSKAQDTAKHPTMYRTALIAKIL